MADSGNVKALAGGLESSVKKALIAMFEYVLGDIRVGLPGHHKRATNLRWIQVDAATHATANTEFTVAHGLDRTPVMLIPTLDLSVVNATMPRLTVSRAADTNRLYLTSDSTSASFTIWVE